MMPYTKIEVNSLKDVADFKDFYVRGILPEVTFDSLTAVKLRKREEEFVFVPEFFPKQKEVVFSTEQVETCLNKNGGYFFQWTKRDPIPWREEDGSITVI